MGECVECDEAITQPICSGCLAQRMRIWLGEISPRLVNDVDGFSMNGDTTCLFCGDGISLCAHCFSKDVYEQLCIKNGKVAEEFLSRFDFDLRKELFA